MARAETVFLRSHVLAASEPVSIDDVVNGWGGDFSPGRFAFADITTEIGARYQSVEFGYVSRRFFDLSFSRDTSAFYHQLENDGQNDGLSTEEYDLRLTAAAFEAEGLFSRVEMDYGGIRITPGLAFYRVNHYQFGSLSGFATASDGTVQLNYYFDEDKILDFPTDGSLGEGFSADVEPGLAVTTDLAVEWQGGGVAVLFSAKDLLNRFSFPVAAQTLGCVNIARDGNASCLSSGGVSRENELVTHIAPTYELSVADERSGLALHVLKHDLIKRLGISWAFDAFQLGAYSTRQLLVSYRSEYVSLALALDNHELKDVRDADANIELRLPW